MRILLTLLFSALAIVGAFGQAVPSGGSIIFTGADADVDGFEFMTLARLNLNSLAFTDNGICSNDLFRLNEGSTSIPASGYDDIPKGTFIRYRTGGTADADASDGLLEFVIAVSTLPLNASGEQVIAYTGTANGATGCGGSGTNTYISGINWGNTGWNAGSNGSDNSKAPGTSTDFGPNTTLDQIQYNGSVTGSASTITTSLLDFTNWTGTNSGTGVFTLKDILFNASDYSSGAGTTTSANGTSFTLDLTGLSFSGTDVDTRYMVIVNQTTAPSSPVSRYTCYLGVTSNFSSAPSVVTAVSTPPCGSPTSGSGKVVYFGYSLPSALTVTNLTSNQTYQYKVVAVNGNGHTANIGTAYSSSVILPITLVSFTAKKDDATVKLAFTTATETNNAFFAIERSADGLNFTEIGRMAGAGDSRQVRNYTFTDEKPLARTNYYRLRQIDTDGRFSFSPVASVVLGKTQGVRVFPSPAVNSVTVQFEESTKEDATWEVVDRTGRTLLNGTFEAETASNTIDIAALPAGTYVVRVQTGAQTVVETFVKQ